MGAPAGRVLLLALASRALVLGAMLLADWCFADLDSSARLQGLPCALAGGGGSSPAAATASSTASKPPLAVWDTVYFARVAQCGYETDKINAFFPGIPAVMRTLGGTIAGVLPLLGFPAPASGAAHAVAALAFNVASFCIAALCLHRLGLRVLASKPRASSSRRSTTMASNDGGSGSGSGSSSSSTKHRLQQQEQEEHGEQERVADLALLLFCCNPASVFYSAAYSECLFAAATWAGLLLLPHHHWAGVAALAVAATARSNGILGVWFPLHKALVAAAHQQRLSAREAVRMVLSCTAILAPYVAMQAQAYLAHCISPDAGTAGGTMDASLPPWCSSRLPSVYGYIQREYWDVGLLRFYQDPSRVTRWIMLPMVLMSVPVALLSITGAWSYFTFDWQRALTLGLFCRGDRLPRWLSASLRNLKRWAVRCKKSVSWGYSRHQQQQQGQQQEAQQAPSRAAATAAVVAQQPTPLRSSQQAAPLMYHWALMTAVALLAMHVNVATRFLSACPPLYWHAAEVLAAGGSRARLLWLWCFAYIVLGCLLFPNFYPWT